MQSIQWQYQPTPEEIEKSKLVPKILGLSFYFSGVIYFIIYYFSDPKNTVFGIILAILYVVELLFWHLYLKKNIGLSGQTIDIDDQRIRIFEIDRNKDRIYPWEDLESFSESLRPYLSKDIPNFKAKDISPDKFFYLGRRKNSFISLRTPAKYIEELRIVLEEKLKEVKE